MLSCLSQNEEIQFPTEIEYHYCRNCDGKPEIINMFISNKHKDLFFVSEINSDKIFIEKDSYNVNLKSNEIDYSQSFLLGRQGARFVKITPTDDFFEFGKYKARKYILDLPEYKMMIFVDESSKINNTPFLNKKYGIISPPELPKGLMVRIDMFNIDETLIKENVWLLQDVNTKSKKSFFIDFNRIKLLERNLEKEFGNVKVVTEEIKSK